MSIHRPVLLTLCLAMGLATAASPTLAASSNANSASKGYPNGRPWQAVKFDFIAIKQKLDALAGTIVSLGGDVELINEDFGLLREDVAALSDNLAAISNTLEIQVSVMDDAARNDGNDAPVSLFVHVTQHGQPVTGLTADNFSFTNAFPVAGADFCGVGCFTAGDAGIYVITLNGDWSATSYAGALSASSTNGDVISSGSTMVNFDIPAAPPEL